MHRKTDLNNKIAIGVWAVIGIFVFVHATPELSVRERLICDGYIKSAFTASIQKSDELVSGKGGRYTRVYYVAPIPPISEHDKSLEFHPDRYFVTTFILSFANMDKGV